MIVTAVESQSTRVIDNAACAKRHSDLQVISGQLSFLGAEPSQRPHKQELKPSRAAH
jgi:hypothetical protein